MFRARLAAPLLVTWLSIPLSARADPLPPPDPAVAPATGPVAPPPAPPPATPPAAPPPPAPAPPKEHKEHKEHWYDRIQIRGYSQLRYNRFGGDGAVKNPNDRSVGENNGFLLRRARLILSGDVHPQLAVYLQSDFASIPLGDVNNVAQMRDWYADIALDEKKTLRFRAGQSKVPYGFENMQSSQNRAPLDRTDALNTGVKDERDIGVFFYFAPEQVRRTFKHLVDSGLKGSGDYGMLAFGVYNGQTANQPEANEYRHFVARATYPFEIGSQTLELSVGGYGGMFRPKKGTGITGDADYKDIRVHGSFVLYPKPFGLQAEYNWGTGPEQWGTRVDQRPLVGGYVMAMVKAGPILPYVRAFHYDGGRKTDTNAPRNEIKEIEGGIEWQPHKALELTGAFAHTIRKVTNDKGVGIEQEGNWIRLQLQVNY